MLITDVFEAKNYNDALDDVTSDIGAIVDARCVAIRTPSLRMCHYDNSFRFCSVCRYNILHIDIDNYFITWKKKC